MTYWLSYGGGVNSTALLVLLCEGKLPQYEPWRVVWADTRDEKDATYDYVFAVVQPYLHKRGRVLEVVCDDEGVLARWQRLHTIGSRRFRSCTDHAKVRPISRHIKVHGAKEDRLLLGIDAGEAHRASVTVGTDGRTRLYPLVELNMDREACVAAIVAGGLPVPPKSGCWHCPFNRKAETLALAKGDPDRFALIEALELAANARPDREGRDPIYHWHDKPTSHWKGLAHKPDERSLFETEPVMPCGCYDGEEEPSRPSASTAEES